MSPSPITDVVSAVLAHGTHRPAKAALIDQHGPTSYRELAAGIERLSAWLRSGGIRPGEVVATGLAPSVAYATLVLAVLDCGAVVAPLNTRLSASERSSFIARLRPSWVVCDEVDQVGVAGAASVTTVEDPGLGLAKWIEQVVRVPTRRWADVDPAPCDHPASAPALALGTGGTTGLPKAATFSREALGRWCAAAVHAQRLVPGDVELYASPFFHGTLLTSLLTVLTTGATAVVVADPGDPGHRQLVDEAEVTRLGGSPTLLGRLAAGPLADEEVRSRVRVVQYGTTAASPAFVDAMCDAFPNAELVTGYGATEYGPVTRVFAEDRIGRDDAGVGRPLPFVSMRVLDGAVETTEPGVEGELVVRCPWQMSGYWRDTPATEAAFTGSGFVRSGDIAMVDRDGYVHLRGRKKEIIITGGENVHPAEVERALGAHPMISEIAVYGVPDAEWGERVEAAVVAAGPELDIDSIRSFGRTRLAGYKLPRRVRRVVALPLTSNSKVDRRALRQQAIDSDDG